jgi:hypothetical protein
MGDRGCYRLLVGLRSRAGAERAEQHRNEEGLLVAQCETRKFRRAPTLVEGLKTAPPNSDVEADEALGRCAPSGLRSLTPVVGQTARRRD